MSRTELIPPQQLGMPHVPLIMQPRSKNYSSQAVDVSDDYVRADFTNWNAANGTVMTAVPWTLAQFRYFDETIWATNWGVSGTAGTMPVGLYVGTLNGVNLTMPGAPTATVPNRAADSYNLCGGFQGVRATQNTLALYQYVWQSGNSSSYSWDQRFFNLSGSTLTQSLSRFAMQNALGDVAKAPMSFAQTVNAIGFLAGYNNSSTAWNYYQVTNFDADASGYAVNFTHANTSNYLFSQNPAYQIHPVDNSRFIALCPDGDTVLLPALTANVLASPSIKDIGYTNGACGGMVGNQRFVYYNYSTRVLFDTNTGAQATQLGAFSGVASPQGVIRLSDTQSMHIRAVAAGSAINLMAQVYSQSGSSDFVAVGSEQSIGTVPQSYYQGWSLRGFTLPGNRVFIWLMKTSGNSTASYDGGYYCILKGAT